MPPPDPTPKSPAVPPPPAPREPLFVRFLKGLARLGLVAAGTVLLGLAVLTFLPTVAEALGTLLNPTATIPQLAGWLSLAFLLLVPAALMALARWRHWMTSWLSIAAGYIVIVPVLVWLAWDDATVRRPVSLDELCPPGPQAAESWELTLAYTPHDGKPAARTFTAPKFSVGADPAKTAEWQAFIEKNGDAIRATWENLPERAWWAELNRYAVLGDLMSARVDAPIVRFQSCRVVCQFGCAYASLLALEGKGDEAMDALLPILEVSRKLEPSARSLVRLMVARVIQKMSIHTARFILDHATVSADRRARLAAALRTGGGGPVLARRLMLLEYAHSSAFLLHGFGPMIGPQPAWWQRPLNLASRVFFNPVATVNACGERAYELAGLAERRELAAFGTREQAFASRFSSPHFKNPIGGLLLSMSMPAYTKVLDHFWKTEDLRLALLADLEKN